MKTKKSNRLILFGLIAVIVIGTIIFGIFSSVVNDNTAKLNLTEKRWIENNKNKVIDVAVLNNLPIFGSEGKGIFFTYMQDFESDTNLTFNKIPYNYGSETPEAQYTFRVLNCGAKVGKNDLLFYEDNYVILGKENRKIIDTASLGATKIGVLADDLASISTYLNSNNNISYTPVNSDVNLFNMFDSGSFNYIIVPKDMYLGVIVQKKYYINYLLGDLSDKYVLTLDKDNATLNSIIKKTYTTWMGNYLTDNYNYEMFNLYCTINSISDKSRTAFESKRYVYGYVENMPYEGKNHGKYAGINTEFINGFANFASVEFTYQQYNSVADLNQALKKGKVDIAFNYYSFSGLSNKLDYTIEPYNGDYVVLSHLSNNEAIDSVKGLKGKLLYAVKNTKLADYAAKNISSKIITFNRVKDLRGNKEALLLVDSMTYDYYKSNILSDYTVVYHGQTNINYNYVVMKNSDNQLFYNIFQYYLSTINHNQYRNAGMNKVLLNAGKIDFSLLWLYLILIFILIIIVMIIIGKKKRIRRIRNDDKAKYIDPLTSLKNRYYLSCNMPKWEENTIYPQAIMIIDLNNLKDVNDSYGHEEGDRLIKTTANILINNQLEKTDIVRTDGNEFLIYMVGYDENQVITYMRKLYRLLKELPYEYGASLGYSMIEDDIKTIDDAINEAVLDMITNKETGKNTDE